MQIQKIEEIAEISFGLYTNGRHSVSSPSGTIPYLQISDFDSFGKLQVESISSFMDEKDFDSNKHLLRGGDILMPARGIKNNAYLFQEDIQAVASTLFFVIRVYRESPIIPEFLCIYLNHPNTQNKIKAMVSSSVTVPTINKKDFLELSVPVISGKEQQKIIYLNQLHQEERATLTQLVAKKEQLTNAIITQILSDSRC